MAVGEGREEGGSERVKQTDAIDRREGMAEYLHAPED
jgi:hypothetical protein